MALVCRLCYTVVNGGPKKSIATMFFPNDPTQNNTEWYVSEEPRARLGKGIIGQIKYSPDGTQLAVGSSIGIWLYNAHTGKELNLLTGHTKGPSCIAYSPNGHTLASGGTMDTGVCLWDPNTGEHKVTLSEREERVTCVEFSPDGRILASESIDGTIRLWDIVTGKHKATLDGDIGGRELIVFSPDGETLASADNSGLFVGLWNIETDEHKVTLEKPDFHTNSIAFSPDGNTIVTGGWDKNIDGGLSVGAVRLWDAATGKHKEELIKERTDSVFTVAYSPNGASLVSGSKDGTILLWDTATYQLKASLTGYPDAIAFSPDSSTLAIAGRDRKIRLWDAVNGEHQLTLTEQTDEVYSLIFNPDGRTFAGIGGDSTIRLWDAGAGGHLQTIIGHTRSVSSISFSPDSNTIATGSGDDDGTSGDKRIRIWNVQSGDLQSTLKVPIGRWLNASYRKRIDAVSYSPDGKTLASGSEDGTIRIWNVESEKLQATTFEGFRGATREPSSGYSELGLVLAYSPDGKVLATSSRKDTTIQLWDAFTCKHKNTLITETEHFVIDSISFLPDGHVLAAGGRRGEVCMWDVTSGELKTTFPAPEHAREHGWFRTRFEGSVVAFSPDGRTLASVDRGYGWMGSEVCLWDVASGECKASFGMGAGAGSIAFSPDGSALAIGEYEGVTLWDVKKILHHSHDDTYIYATDEFDVTGRHKATLKGHTRYVSAVAFSPDGRTLASGSIDGTVLLWDVTKNHKLPNR